MSISLPRALRPALALDAIATGATALLAIAAADPIASLTALPEPLLRGAGLILVPFVMLVAYAAARNARGLAVAIVGLNALWVIASIVVLATGIATPNALGYAFVAAQALVVGVFAELQYLALRREATVPART